MIKTTALDMFRFEYITFSPSLSGDGDCTYVLAITIAFLFTVLLHF